jgi:hypothetical protein
MAGTTGLEPATSAVTGQRSNQLSYVPSWIYAGICPATPVCNSTRRLRCNMNECNRSGAIQGAVLTVLLHLFRKGPQQSNRIAAIAQLLPANITKPACVQISFDSRITSSVGQA